MAVPGFILTGVPLNRKRCFDRTFRISA